VSKLSPHDTTEEDNLNACSVLLDALDTQAYYQQLTKRSNLLKLLDFAVPTHDDSLLPAQQAVESQNAALTLLSQLVAMYNSSSSNDKRKGEEETVMLEEGDNEEDLVNVISRNVSKIVSYLEA
jgi:hypothetical protein